MGSSTAFARPIITPDSALWQPNLEIAIQQAQAEDKPILLVFAGSDWCRPCMQLDQEIWQTEDFLRYAAENLVLVKADFPRKKKNRLSETQQAINESLAETYNPEGAFPLVLLLNAEGKVLAQCSYLAGGWSNYLNRWQGILKP